jgi:hypothetical protein
VCLLLQLCKININHVPLHMTILILLNHGLAKEAYKCFTERIWKFEIPGAIRDVVLMGQSVSV